MTRRDPPSADDNAIDTSNAARERNRRDGVNEACGSETALDVGGPQLTWREGRRQPMLHIEPVANRGPALDTVRGSMPGDDGMRVDVPYAARFDDTYFSLDDGRAETRAVFIDGNRLVERFRSGDALHIAELGFGTGLNFFETVRVFAEHGASTATLTYTSFEQFPLRIEDMRRTLAGWPDTLAAADDWLAAWPEGLGVIDGQQRSARDVEVCDDQSADDMMVVRRGPVTLRLVLGDARTRITRDIFSSPVDAWFLDGFSPAKNPELWSHELMAHVFAHTAPGGTFSTYTAAGFVRRGLEAAGFLVDRVPGFARKRERLQGMRPRAPDAAA
ncbi:MAG: tRNA (5-methylaminomethyl-2-thiouridine)(34)-methyltransferase MnmD [Pseudomonadota bacterium]